MKIKTIFNSSYLQFLFLVAGVVVFLGLLHFLLNLTTTTRTLCFSFLFLYTSKYYFYFRIIFYFLFFFFYLNFFILFSFFLCIQLAMQPSWLHDCVHFMPLLLLIVAIAIAIASCSCLLLLLHIHNWHSIFHWQLVNDMCVEVEKQLTFVDSLFV